MASPKKNQLLGFFFSAMIFAGCAELAQEALTGTSREISLSHGRNGECI